MPDPRFPIGPYQPPSVIQNADLTQWIAEIERLPHELEAAVGALTPAQLDTPYRDGGWTVRQVVHHLADSHMNSQIRFRLALTEETPTIKPYLEARWAELIDGRSGAIEPSLEILRGLHARWVLLLRGFGEAEWKRRLVHPEHPEPRDLAYMAGLYAWHGRHHTAHVLELRRREGW
ncbi:MAG: bacillithiol transferase BstA [Candidatus Eisenbacteria bacterium]